MLNDLYWNLDPVLFSAGPFTVRWYGIAYVAGFVCAALLIWRLAKRWRIRVDADALLTIMFCVIIGVVAGCSTATAWSSTCRTPSRCSRSTMAA